LSIGPGTEIDFDAMVEFYGAQGLKRQRAKADVASEAPAASRVLRPKVMRNHSGKPVSVNRWMPKRVD